MRGAAPSKVCFATVKPSVFICPWGVADSTMNRKTTRLFGANYLAVYPGWSLLVMQALCVSNAALERNVAVFLLWLRLPFVS